MTVPEPTFTEAGRLLCCDECPFDDARGVATDLCGTHRCPTRSTYADAAALAHGA